MRKKPGHRRYRLSQVWYCVCEPKPHLNFFTPRMKTLISNTVTNQLIYNHSSPVFIFHFPSISHKNPNFLNFPNRKLPFTPKTHTFCSSKSPTLLSCNGWDDLSESVESGVSNQLRSFLNSLGIDDKKYIFVYLLGFVCALAISRVRVSSIVVFPACFLVFAVGFSIGVVNGGKANHVNELSSIGSKKRPKDDENFRVLIERLINLVDLFKGFDVKIVNLKNCMRKDVNSNRVTKIDLESYMKEMESIGKSALQGKSMIEGCIDNLLVDAPEVAKTLNQKPSSQKKEVGRMGFDLSQFIAGFRESSIGSKPNKVKDQIVRKDSRNIEVNDHSRVNILAPAIAENIMDSLYHDNKGNGNERFSRVISDNNVRVQDTAEREAISEIAEMNLMEMETGAKRVFDREEYIFKNNRIHYMENEHLSSNTHHRNSVQTCPSPEGLLDFDVSVSLKHTRTEASFGQEQNFKKINGKNHMPTDNMENREKEDEFASSPSSVISDDMLFNKFLVEANILLKHAKESLRHRGNEGDAENALYESTKLLSKAIDMKPMSLLAVGQLGNTYLLHGELKLKITRELRALLARNDDQVVSREKVANYLVNVCEECEELLVMAGRKYRLALSIDENDMRALYNWGLALSFRAQLIADIGPEAALDADKVYMAAIDKFDAMMSKSNVHAPDALFRWGMALQQRSRLRARKYGEKVKLLNQAKRLYEDALDMGSNSPQVREALSSCISELNYSEYS